MLKGTALILGRISQEAPLKAGGRLKAEQARGISDPLATVVEEVDPEGSCEHVKRLAEGFLRQQQAHQGRRSA
jgi:hypothetical protein